MERVQAHGELTRAQDPHPARRIEVIAQVMAKRDEIDEVVRVQVADEDGVQFRRWDLPEDALEGPVAEVQENPRCPALDEVARARRAIAVGVGGAGAEDGQAHAKRCSIERA